MSKVEEWRSVLGEDGRYEVSSFGGVRSLDRVVQMLSSRGKPCKKHMRGRRLRTGLNTHGYPACSISGKTREVHALVCEAFHGPRPEGNECRHLDGSRTNNRSDNLAWGTVSENRQDQFLHGTALSGERQGASKLTNRQVLEIRKRAAMGDTHTSIAIGFPVSRSMISKIVRRESWGHLAVVLLDADGHEVTA